MSYLCSCKEWQRKIKTGNGRIWHLQWGKQNYAANYIGMKTAKSLRTWHWSPQKPDRTPWPWQHHDKPEANQQISHAEGKQTDSWWTDREGKRTETDGELERWSDRAMERGLIERQTHCITEEKSLIQIERKTRIRRRKVENVFAGKCTMII